MRVLEHVIARGWKLELSCRRCGVAYVPSLADLRRGPSVYYRCPTCRVESSETATRVMPKRTDHIPERAT